MHNRVIHWVYLHDVMTWWSFKSFILGVLHRSNESVKFRNSSILSITLDYGYTNFHKFNQLENLNFFNCLEWITDFFAIVNSGYVVNDLLPSKFSQRKSSFLKNGAIQQHFADVHIVIFHSCKVQNQNIHEISWTKSTHTIFTSLFTLFNLISRSKCICFNVSTFGLKHPEAYCSNHQ